MSIEEGEYFVTTPAEIDAACRCIALQDSTFNYQTCRKCSALLEKKTSGNSQLISFARSKLMESRPTDRIDPKLVYNSLKRNSIGSFIYDRNFPHTIKRKRVLEFTSHICRQFGFTLTTFYQTVDFVNTLSSTKAFPTKNPKQTAQVCVYLAAKTIESRRALPSLNQYLFQTNCELNRTQYIDREAEISNLLDFHFNRTTPYTVYAFLAQVGLMKQSELPNRVWRSPENTKRLSEVENLCLLFLELCTQHYYFYQFPSCVIAAACVVQARNGLNLPPWPAELQHLTGISIVDMSRCIESITCLYRELKHEILNKFSKFLRSITGNFGSMMPLKSETPHESSLDSIKYKNNKLVIMRTKKIAKASRRFASVENNLETEQVNEEEGMMTPPGKTQNLNVICSAPHFPFMRNVQ